MACLNKKILLLTGLVWIGTAGGVQAMPDYRDVVRDSDGDIVHDSNGGCVRTRWQTDRDYCAPRCVDEHAHMQPTRRSAEDLTQEDRTVYFNFNRSTLTREGMERLNTLVHVLKSDQSVKEARIVGYADRIGREDYNQRLSQKRAEAVLNYLVVNGYTNARVTETRWVGESEPTATCSSQQTRAQLIQCLHNDRRVEVEIEYSSDD